MHIQNVSVHASFGWECLCILAALLATVVRSLSILWYLSSCKLCGGCGRVSYYLIRSTNADVIWTLSDVMWNSQWYGVLLHLVKYCRGDVVCWCNCLPKSSATIGVPGMIVSITCDMIGCVLCDLSVDLVLCLCNLCVCDSDCFILDLLVPLYCKTVSSVSLISLDVIL